MGEEKRHEMMETLFGAESEDSDDEPEPERQPRRVALSDQASDHSDKEGSYEGEGDDGGGDAELEEAESEGERGESDGERGISDDGDGERAESEGGREELDPESEGEREEVAELSASGSERSPGPQFAEEYEDEEVQEETRVSEDEQEPRERVEVAKARDVFGESDEEEEEEDNQAPQQERLTPEESPERARSESPERARSESPGAEDIVRDEEDREDRYDSEDDRDIQQKPEKLMGPPIQIKVPLRPPPGMPDQLNIVRMSNIMNIDMKPFDPETYEAEESFTTEVEGRKQHIRLEENVVRWRPDREGNYESNARFVRWSDGSLQLLLGSEVLDLSVQNATQDQSHLFVRHHKSILQSQGQVLRKMRFMPSSLTSKSHRLLTALVDVKHKKTFKVKAVITETDPEKEKHEKEKAVQDIIRARVDLQRKQERVQANSRNYSSAPSRPRVVERERGLSPGYLEDALDEEDDGHDRRNRRRQEQQLEQEQRAERRIMQAKRQAPAKPPPSSRSMQKSRRPKSDDFLDNSMSEADSDVEPSVQGSDEIVGGAWEEEDDDEEEEQERRLPSSSRGGARDMDSRYNGEDDSRKRKKEIREERSPSPAKKLSRRRVVVSDSDDD